MKKVLPGMRLGRYLVEDFVGSGAQGQVFFARQINAAGGKACLIKIAPSLDVLEEAARAISLGAHANVVQVLDAEVCDGVPFFAMEYADGADLEVVLEAYRKKEAGLPLDFIYTVLLHLATALHAAHYESTRGGKPLGLVHRDVKPANILVTLRGYAKLCDFGISTCMTAQQTGMHMRGTPAYMSREHVYSKVVPSMDVYSLGVVAWEMLENRSFRPEAKTHADHVDAILRGVVPSITRRDVPAELVELVNSCLLEARERPTAHEFCTIIQKAPGFKVRTDRVGDVVEQVLGRGSRSRDTQHFLEAVDLESPTSKPRPPSMITASVASRDYASSSDEVDEDKRTIALPATREEEVAQSGGRGGGAEPVTVKKKLTPLFSAHSAASAEDGGGGLDVGALARTEVLPALPDGVMAPRVWEKAGFKEADLPGVPICRYTSEVIFPGVPTYRYASEVIDGVWKTARFKEEKLPGVPTPQYTSEPELEARGDVTDDVELSNNSTSPLLPPLEERSSPLLRDALLFIVGVMLAVFAAGWVAGLILGGT